MLIARLIQRAAVIVSLETNWRTTFLKWRRSLQLVSARRAALNDLLMSPPEQDCTVTKKGHPYTSVSVVHFTPPESCSAADFISATSEHSIFGATHTPPALWGAEAHQGTASEGAQNPRWGLHSSRAAASALAHNHGQTASAPGISHTLQHCLLQSPSLYSLKYK